MEEESTFFDEESGSSKGEDNRKEEKSFTERSETEYEKPKEDIEKGESAVLEEKPGEPDQEIKPDEEVEIGKEEQAEEKKKEAPPWLLPAGILGIAVLLLLGSTIYLIMKKKGKAKPVKVTETEEAVVVSFNYEILQFRYKSTDIKDVIRNLKTVEKKVAKKIEKIPEDKKISVYGYADAKGPEGPVGEKPGNIYLSKKRAEAIADYFVNKYGLDRTRFKIFAMGSKDLKDEIEPYSGINRRVVIKFEK